MNPEQPGPSPEFKSELYPDIFDFERMSIEQVKLLISALSADVEKYEQLLGSLGRGLCELPRQNVQRARDLVEALAQSDVPDHREEAAVMLAELVRREQELDANHLERTLLHWVKLLNDPDGKVSECALLAICDAVEKNQLRPDVKAWVTARLP